MQIDVQGLRRDLHSRADCGAIQNPGHPLAAILASLRWLDGKILVKGFYDGARSLTDEERVTSPGYPSTSGRIWRVWE